MENDTKFSTNTLLNSLRALLNSYKEKLACEHIQEGMNIIQDLEYEIQLLQTNYDNTLLQSKKIEKIEQHVCELLHTSVQKSSRTTSAMTTTLESAVDQSAVDQADVDQADVDQGADQTDSESTNSIDNAEEWAEHIATLVVQKIAEME